MRVYHFLSADYGLHDVALRRIKIARLADLNDPFELEAVHLGGKKQFRKVLRAWKRDLNDSKGLLCFSKSWLSPVLWSHYADKHKGMALGFDLSDKYLKEVTYAAERILARSGSQSEFVIDEDLMQSLLYTKYEHWRYEEEVRVFVDLDPTTVEGGNYFYPFTETLQLREVVLGHRCDIPIDRVRQLVDSTYKSVKVAKARLAFKSFKVVPDKRFK